MTLGHHEGNDKYKNWEVAWLYLPALKALREENANY